MADKSTQAVVSALERALAEPTGLPLYGGKGESGLFPPSLVGRQAAQRCVDEGHLHIVRTETRGKATLPICKLTDKGLSYLLAQMSPRQVLEDLVRAVEARQTQVGELLQTTRQLVTALDELKATTLKVVGDLQVQSGRPAPPPPPTAWKQQLLSILERWRGVSSEDCPLPELYRLLAPTAPELTIGQFHDELRAQYDAGQIYLHPWPGPLYDLPEPPFALLVGHVIAYYASKS